MSECLTREKNIVNNINLKNNNNNIKFVKNEKIKNYIENLTTEQSLKFWIKTLFGAYSIVPEIINTIDKIIELQASSTSFILDIYNKEGSAFNQVEKVINLTERKNNLVNIYLLIKQLYASLKADNIEIVEKKYLYNYSAEDLSRELEVSSRTIYRKLDRIVDEVYDYCEKHNIGLKFIESQLKQEEWLWDRYYKNITDYFKNINYTDNYSMSSSGL